MASGITTLNKEELSLISADNNFAQLLSFSIDKNGNGVFRIRFSYVVNVIDTVRNGGNRVKISVIKPEITAAVKSTQSNFESFPTFEKYQGLLVNRTAQQTTPTTYGEIVNVYCDIRNSVDNSAIKYEQVLKADRGNYSINGRNISKDVVIPTIDFVQTSTLDLKKSVKNCAVMVSSGENGEVFDTNLARTYDNLINFHHLDPSDVAETRDLMMFTRQNSLGLSNSSTSNNSIEEIFKNYKNHLLGDLRSITTSDTSNNDFSFLTPVVTNGAEKFTRFESDVTFATNLNKLGQLNVDFQVIETSGSTISKISRALNVKKLLATNNSPTHPPTVHHTFDGDYIVFNITSNDQSTAGVDVYKRSFRPTVKSSSLDFQLINQLKLVNGRATLSVRSNIDKHSYANIDFYRFVPYGEYQWNTLTKVNSSHFKGVVVGNKNSQHQRTVSIDCESVFNGVKISILNFPIDATSFTIKRRRIDDKVFTFIGNSILATPRTLTVVDTTAVSGTQYEYVCDVNFSSGITKTLTSKFFKHQAPTQIGDLKITIADPQIIDANDPKNIDVNFGISFSEIDTDTGSLLQLLKKQGISEYFINEISQNRVDIKSLISYRVMRHELSTGVVDTFPIINGSVFSDKAGRLTSNIRPPTVGEAYRYEVAALIRDVQSTIDNLVTTKTGSLGKIYSFAPSKFLHPIALKTGQISTPETRHIRHSESFMEYGDIGVSTSVSLVINSQKSCTISTIGVNKITTDEDEISIKIDGDYNLIDHMIIMKNFQGAKSGVRSIIGRVFPTTNDVKFVVRLDKNTVIEPYTYLIYPVYRSMILGV